MALKIIIIKWIDCDETLNCVQVVHRTGGVNNGWRGSAVAKQRQMSKVLVAMSPSGGFVYFINRYGSCCRILEDDIYNFDQCISVLSVVTSVFLRPSPPFQMMLNCRKLGVKRNRWSVKLFWIVILDFEPASTVRRFREIKLVINHLQTLVSHSSPPPPPLPFPSPWYDTKYASLGAVWLLPHEGVCLRILMYVDVVLPFITVLWNFHFNFL